MSFGMTIDQGNLREKLNGGESMGAISGHPLDMIFDSSGWAVATGGSKATATAEKRESAGLSLPPWLLAVVAAVVVVGWIRTAKP